MNQYLVFVLDDSDAVEHCFDRIKKIASEQRAAKVYLVRILKPWGRKTLVMVPDAKLGILSRASEVEASKYLTRIGADLAEEGIEVVPVILVTGKPSWETTDLGKRHNIDLIFCAGAAKPTR